MIRVGEVEDRTDKEGTFYLKRTKRVEEGNRATHASNIFLFAKKAL